MYDPLDQRIIAALYVNGRASWRTIARVLGANETTVARHGQRLIEEGAAQIVGVLDVLRSRLGVPVMTRIRCQPRQIERVASELAALDESRFVTLVTGTTDCVVELVAQDQLALRRLLLQTLARTPGVVTCDTQAVLRTFISAYDWDPGLLSPKIASELRPQRANARVGEPEENNRELTKLERGLAEAFRHDGRRSFTDVAKELDVSESTVVRRVESLVSRGRLRFRTLVDLNVFGFEQAAMVWLQVAPGYLDAIGRQLLADHRVMYLAATSGTFQIIGEVALRRHEELYDFVEDTLGKLEGVQGVDATLEFQTIKRAGVVRDSAELPGITWKEAMI